MFAKIEAWLPEITAAIKKDIKVDYIPGTPEFHRKYFGNRPLSRIPFEEMQEAFKRELLAGNEEMAEWVVNRWVFQHGDVYTHFAERMMKVNAEFDQIKEFSVGESEEILQGAIESFGAKAVYLFSVLNQVVFPAGVFDKLRAAAEAEKASAQAVQATAEQTSDLNKLIDRHNREMTRLHEKYEQKVSGVLKKYTTDIEALKSQVRALQKQLTVK